MQQARLHLPVGIASPSPNYLAGDLRGTPPASAGRHRRARLTTADLKAHQLADPFGS